MANAKVNKQISALHVNGMNGRILRMPMPKGKKRHILLLYGHHASIERMYGFAEIMHQYGAVTMPDLPGFGGMDSFYKIGEKPTLDNYADYMASLMKLYYKRKKVTIAAMSFACLIVTRMLQKHPELKKNVELLVTISGFVHKDDFIFNKRTMWSLRFMSFVFSKSIPASIMQNVILTRPVIKTTYALVSGNHSKMKDAIDQAELKRRIDFEVNLWKINDVKTRMKTQTLMFTVDLCNKQVDLPIYNVIASEDRYFDSEVVRQHMHVIYKDVHIVASSMGNHAPSILATAKEASPYVPPRIRRLLK